MHRSARAAADYTGAMLAGGRWNPIGTPMLYTAQHLSLACIEVLVHLDKSQLPRDYVWSRAEAIEYAGGSILWKPQPCRILPGSGTSMGGRW